jgi:hypothetical protein
VTKLRTRDEIRKDQGAVGSFIVRLFKSLGLVATALILLVLALLALWKVASLIRNSLGYNSPF